MSPEWVTAIGTVGTFIVILASALAALAQLRHSRGSNQIVALTECRETLESPAFREAQRFVSYELPKRLTDPHEAARAAVIPFTGDYEAIGTVANFFESMGAFVKNGIIDRQIACDTWSFVVLRNWNALVPVITYVRQRLNQVSVWENFEFLAAISKQYVDRHPNSYPRGVPHMAKDFSLCELMERTASGPDW